MMYTSPARAREALKRFTTKRNYLVEGEVISPAEEWLVATINDFLPVNKHSADRRTKRRLIGVARCLNLYPIPNWWAVRERIMNRDSNGDARMAALIEMTADLLDDKAMFDAYLKGDFICTE